MFESNLTIVILTGRVHISMAPCNGHLSKKCQMQHSKKQQQHQQKQQQEYLHDVPIRAVSEEREDLCAAETEHEEEGGEDVDPEVDDNDHGEHVDRLVALLWVRGHSDQPDRPSYQPGDLEDDVD